MFRYYHSGTCSPACARVREFGCSPIFQSGSVRLQPVRGSPLPESQSGSRDLLGDPLEDAAAIALKDAIGRLIAESGDERQQARRLPALVAVRCLVARRTFRIIRHDNPAGSLNRGAPLFVPYPTFEKSRLEFEGRRQRRAVPAAGAVLISGPVSQLAEGSVLRSGMVASSRMVADRRRAIVGIVLGLRLHSLTERKRNKARNQGADRERMSRCRIVEVRSYLGGCRHSRVLSECCRKCSTLMKGR